ncbi:MAG: AMP-binding protein [Bradymonadia bacterium]
MTCPQKDLLLPSFYRLVEQRADQTFMSQPMGGGVVDNFSFARVFDESRRMASYLKSLGLPEGSKIAIISKNCAHFIMSDLAIWMAGYTSVALYPILPAEEVEYILEHSEAKAVFVGKLDNWAEMAPGVPDDLPRISYPLSPKNDFPTWNDLIKAHEPLPDPPTREAEDLALIVYTSGSTGRPKGVMHDFGGISISARGLINALELKPNERMLSYLPLAHVMERWLVETVGLVLGFHIFFAESLDTFVADLRRARPTVFVSVPRLWLKFQLGVFKKMPPKKLKRFLKIPILSGVVRKKVLTNLGLDSVRMAASGSAPIPPDLIQWYRDLGLELLEGYGMSENFCFSHASLPGRGKVGYVGNCYPGVECRISEEGEILVKSPGNMKGYYKNPEATAESFTEDGFLKTGDRGEIDSAGRLRITGRVKELFKTSKGKYVAPAPIENKINTNAHVEMSCVMGSGRPSAFALIQVAEELHPKLNDASFRAELEQSLTAQLQSVNSEVAKHERLGFMVVVSDRWTPETGFLTPTQKMKRNKLEDVYGPKLDGWYGEGKPVVFA